MQREGCRSEVYQTDLQLVVSHLNTHPAVLTSTQTPSERLKLTENTHTHNIFVLTLDLKRQGRKISDRKNINRTLINNYYYGL